MGDVRQFQKRVQQLRSADSPHVPPILDAGMLNGTWFVATEGFGGRSVTQLSEALGAISEEEALALGLQLFRALAHLHARNAIVGQINPDTVVIGEDGVVRIWRAFVRGRARSGGKTLALGRVSFTAMTYSPVDTGQDKRDRDVYGAGMVLATLLAGGPPVQPKSLPELLTFVQKPSFSFTPPIRPEIEALLLSTVAPQANKRPPARGVYSKIMALTGLKPRQAERIAAQVVSRQAGAALASV
jgi:serine/threonine-protein kinase